MVCVGSHAYSTAQGAHGGDHFPLVGLWAVIFTSLEALLSIEATTNVNLGRTEGPLSNFVVTMLPVKHK